MENNQKLELKIIALKEGFKTKIASTVEEYEERIADLRIELTEQNQNLSVSNDEVTRNREEIERLNARILELERELNPALEEETNEEDPTDDSN